MAEDKRVFHGSKRFYELLKEMADVHSRKNAGYAGIGAKDPLSNFKLTNKFGVSPFIGCIVRISDKMSRIWSLSKNTNADQVGESITDTLLDLATYSLIAIVLYEQENGAHQPKWIEESRTTEGENK